MKMLKGANIDIDLIPNPEVSWEQDKCPWEQSDQKIHKCAIKNVSLCKYFKGIEYPDTILCDFDEKNKSIEELLN